MTRTIPELQEFIGAKPDGIWGSKSQAALEAILLKTSNAERRTLNVEVGGTGTSRTDWRGYVNVNTEKLRLMLPDSARPLLPAFMQAALENDLNPLFLIAISRHETAAWTSKVFHEKRNAMGISNRQGAIACESHEASILAMASLLARKNGYYAKCRTLGDIAAVYAPVGAENDPGQLNAFWPKSVAKYWQQMEQTLRA